MLHRAVASLEPALQEVTVFPYLNKKMDFSHEKEQHETVHAFLDDFLAVVREAQKDVAKFDAGKLQQMLLDAEGPMVRISSARHPRRPLLTAREPVHALRRGGRAHRGRQAARRGLHRRGVQGDDGRDGQARPEQRRPLPARAVHALVSISVVPGIEYTLTAACQQRHAARVQGHMAGHAMGRPQRCRAVHASVET